VTAVLFDLGVSSMQLDVAERGFAYSVDAPLDMRMNPQGTLTAAEILNTWSEQDIAKVLWEYSGEKFAKRIAREVGKRRAASEFVSSSQLVELLYAVIPAPARRTGGHPAKRTFQALRIAVNDELGALRQAVPDALDALVVGGRIVVMSYQSGEDSIVKAEFTRRSTSDVPLGLPLTADQIQAPFRLLTRGAETATDMEVAENSRAASVKLRAIERVAA
jgi:16S rRNA (cytosine1402-N4)-methyltransferase